MSDKPNTPYASSALAEIMGDLLDRAVQTIPPPKPEPKNDKQRLCGVVELHSKLTTYNR